MKELQIQLNPRIRLVVEVTQEMEQDFYECWEIAEHTEKFKDCNTCSWYAQSVTEGTLACEIVEERCSSNGKIFTHEI